MARKLAIAGDHASFRTKNILVGYLREQGFNIEDCGPSDERPVDYPDYAAKVAKLVASGEVEKGILVCGSGIGMSIAANKVDGVRAALCYDHYTALMARQHNDANIVCAGERTTGIEVIKEVVDTFLNTDFLGGEHALRVQKIMNLQ